MIYGLLIIIIVIYQPNGVMGWLQGCGTLGAAPGPPACRSRPSRKNRDQLTGSEGINQAVRRPDRLPGCKLGNRRGTGGWSYRPEQAPAETTIFNCISGFYRPTAGTISSPGRNHQTSLIPGASYRARPNLSGSQGAAGYECAGKRHGGGLCQDVQSKRSPPAGGRKSS